MSSPNNAPTSPMGPEANHGIPRPRPEATPLVVDTLPGEPDRVVFDVEPAVDAAQAQTPLAETTPAPDPVAEAVEAEPTPAPTAKVAQSAGRIARLAAGIESKVGNSDNAGRWFARGDARRAEGRAKWAARRAAISRKFGEMKESTKQTLADVRVLGGVVLKVAKVSYSIGVGAAGELADATMRGFGNIADAAGTAARDTVHTAAAYTHEVRANVADVKMGAVSPRESFAGWRVDRSQGKLDKNQKKLDARRTAATQATFEETKLAREGKYVGALKQKVKAKVQDRMAQFSQGRVNKHQGRLDRRMVPLQKWETRVADYDLQAQLHRDAAQVRRKSRSSR